MTQITQHLQTHGVPFEAIAHQQAYTSIAEARALGIDASEVLKTVAVRGAGGYALMAVPATCRLDMHLVQAAVGDPHVRLATEEELLRDFPGIELGALPPLGSLLGAPLYRIGSDQDGGPAPARAGDDPAVDQARERERQGLAAGSHGSAPPAARIAGRQHAGPEIDHTQ